MSDLFLMVLRKYTEGSQAAFNESNEAFKTRIKETLMYSVKLGDHVQDKITKFHGIASVRVDYLSDTIPRFMVEALSADGKPGQSEYFDESRLEPYVTP